jgi:hypothetical protein
VQGEREGSSFSVLHVYICFFQHQLYKWIVYFSIIYFGTFGKNKIAVLIWAYFLILLHVLRLVLCQYNAVFVIMVQ